MSTPADQINPLSLSDEDFGKLNSPPPAPAAGEGEDAGKESDNDDADPNKDGEDDKNKDDDSGKDDDDDAGTGHQDDPNKDEGKDKKTDKEEGSKPVEKDGKLPAKDKSVDEGKTGDKGAEGKDKPAVDKDGKPVEKSKEGDDATTTPPNYEELYKKIMAPLTANGKKIELKSPEELIQLAQMGANYTRKMQAIAPHRKVLMMLENNGLLDEGKLSLLIDINKKDPEAIKKFLKDSDIDPLEIDTKQDSTYREGNHRVTDEEVVFKTTLDELASNPEGRETLAQINTQWDQASKEILWKQPDVMTVIHQHRENGIYALITTELERQRALGAIPPTVPYLHAYKKIGDDLTAAGAFNHLAEKPVEKEKSMASHVATRKAVPKKDPNGDKANAASTSRNAGRKAETVVNPLSLSDADFEKQFEAFRNRV